MATNFKRVPWRSKRYLQAINGMECTVDSPYCKGDSATVVPAHSNQHSDGKGGSQKADDIFTAAACSICHDFLDMRGSDWRKHPVEEREWYHDRAIKRTLRAMLDKGVLGVK